ncbi:MAG TPA: Hsp20 family protein [Gammaproteobacteria bacterium]
MTNFDFSPFYRSTIGFDRMAQLLENAQSVKDVEKSYPPYDIEAVGKDHYRVTIAAAGFAKSDLIVEVRENTLHVSGKKTDERDDAQYLYRGIGQRAFDRQFRIADHVKMENAWLENGLLTMDLVRELPESMKPRTIAIASGAPTEIMSKEKTQLGGDKKAA